MECLKSKVSLFRPKTRSFKLAALPWFLLILFCQSGFAGETLEKFEQELQELIQSNKESIVTVRAKFSHKISIQKESGLFSLFEDEIKPELREFTFTNIGTGVIFDQFGHIITRSSIVLGALKNEVAFSNGMKLEADLIGYDPGTGFALIKVDPSKLKALKPARLSDSTKVDAGSWSFIMGNSFGAYPAIVIGTVNSVREDGMIQISANLSPGNNGSPIINLKGEVIGLVAGQLMPDSDIGLNWGRVGTSQTTLVYPSNWVKKIADDVIEHGYVKRGWLGVVGYFDGKQPKIGQIKADSPAQKAGLAEGDIVLRFSGFKIKDIAHFARIVESTAPGKAVELEYMRKGEIYSTEVQLTEKRKPEIYSFQSDSSISKRTSSINKNFSAQKNSYQTQKRNKILVERVHFLEQELEKIKQQLAR